MKRKTNKTKEEAWSQTAHAPDGEQPGPEASGTSGQSVPKSKFRKKSQQEQAAAAKLHMESQGEKLEQAREKLAKQKPPKKPGPVKRIGRVASGSVHSFVHGKIFEVEQENVGTEGAHRSELVGETALRHGSRFVRRKVREHPAKVVRKAEARYTKYTADYHFHTAAQEHPELTKNALMLILVCVAIYAVLIQGIATGGDPIGAIWGCIGYTVLLCFMLMKTGTISKSIVSAH